MPASIEIAHILAKRNPERYKAIIERASLNGYHDFKHDSIPGHPEYADCICPKVQLIEDLFQFPELSDIRERVIAGDFDDTADEIDNHNLSLILLDDHAPDFMFEMVGLTPPTAEERKIHFNKISNN